MLTFISELSDGDLLVGGINKAIQGGIIRSWFGRIDPTGTSYDWIYKISQLVADVEIADGIELPSGEIAIIGNSSNGAFIHKVDGPTGNTIQETFVTNTDGTILFNNATINVNNQLVIAGKFNTPSDPSTDMKMLGFTFDYSNLSLINSALFTRSDEGNHTNLLNSSDGRLVFGCNNQNVNANFCKQTVYKTDLQFEGPGICSVPFSLQPTNATNNKEVDGYLPVSIPFSLLSINPSSLDKVDPYQNCCTIPVSINGNTTICEKSTTVLTATGGTNYSWSTGETTASVTISSPGTYEVTVTDANGCVGEASVTVSLADFSNLIITGPDNKCCSNQIYCAPSGYSQYVWTVSNGTFTQISPDCIQITSWDLLGEDSQISLSVEDASGCKGFIRYPVRACCTDAGYSNVALSTDNCGPTLISSLNLGGVYSPFNPSQPILLNHDLIIDVNTTFLNCQNIRIENGRQIIVQPGVQLQFINSNINAKCDRMWDKIFLNDPSSSLIIQNCRIEQGLSAITSENEASVTISGSTFQNNYVGISLKNSNSPYPFSILSSTITSVTGGLLSPYNAPTTRGNTGIKIADVSQATVGDASSPALLNKFQNLDYGILAENSRLNVINNRFLQINNPSNISCTTCQCPVGTAVCLNGTGPLHKQVNIGGVSTEKNFFNGCDFGVFARNRINLNISNNQYLMVKKPVHAQHTYKANHHVYDNTFQNFEIGCNFLDVANADIEVDHNDFNQGTGGLLNKIGNVAVIVQNPLQFNVKANVYLNTIKRVRTGVYFINCFGQGVWPANDLRITENDINFGSVPNTTNLYHIGIRVDGSVNTLVQENTVYRQNPVLPNSAASTRIFGIYINGSPFSTVAKNTITKIGVGILPYGNCFPSILPCNILDQNYYGFYFDGVTGAIIGDQISGGIPTGNIWTTLPTGSDLAGAISSPIYWYFPLNGYQPSTLLSQNSLIGNQLYSSVLLDECSSYSQINPNIEQRLISIITDTNNSFNSDVIKWYNKKNAFNFLQIPSQDFSSNVELQDFLSYNQTRYLGLNKQINDLIESEIIRDTILFSIPLIEPFEYDEYEVKHMALKLVSKIDLSISDSVLLEFYSGINSFFSSPAIFSSRVILGLDIVDVGILDQNRVIQSEISDSLISLKSYVFPNPNVDYFEIKIDENNSITNSEYLIEIFDVFGKKNLEFKSSKKLVQVNHNFSPGVYFVNISGLSSMQKSVTKIVIAE